MSLSETIATATKTVLDALHLVSGSTTYTATKRKRLMILDGESPPILLFAVGVGNPNQLISKGRWIVSYPLSIAAGFAAAGKTADNTTLRDWQDSIWPAIVDVRKLIAAGLTSGNAARPGQSNVFEAGPLGTAQIDWTVLNFQVETVESRY